MLKDWKTNAHKKVPFISDVVEISGELLPSLSTSRTVHSVVIFITDPLVVRRRGATLLGQLNKS